MTAENPTRTEVMEHIVRCRRCELADSVTSPVPFSVGRLGKLTPDVHEPGVIVLGEAPGRIEDARGKPFVGPAGQLLRRALVDCNLRPDSCSYLNVVCCWPSVNEGGTPSAFNLKACRIHLRSQLNALPPSTWPYVLVCGKTALKSLLPRARWESAAVGQLIQVHERLIYPIIHPAALVMGGGRNAPGYGTWRRSLERFIGYVKGGRTQPYYTTCLYCNRPNYETSAPVCHSEAHRRKWQKDQKFEMPKLQIHQDQLFEE